MLLKCIVRYVEQHDLISYDKIADHEKDFIYLTIAGAEYLRKSGIQLVGIDYLSIDKFQAEGYPAHHELLGNGIVIIEGINLQDVKEGMYELICLPLKILNGDGAPARVVLRTLN